MKAKENVKNDINLQTDTLTDLPVADEQADETKGGREGGGVGQVDRADYAGSHILYQDYCTT